MDVNIGDELIWIESDTGAWLDKMDQTGRRRANINVSLYGDSFHDVSSDFTLPAIVKPRYTRVAVAEQVLHIF